MFLFDQNNIILFNVYTKLSTGRELDVIDTIVIITLAHTSILAYVAELFETSPLAPLSVTTADKTTNIGLSHARPKRGD